MNSKLDYAALYEFITDRGRFGLEVSKGSALFDSFEIGQ